MQNERRRIDTHAMLRRMIELELSVLKDLSRRARSAASLEEKAQLATAIRRLANEAREAILLAERIGCDLRALGLPLLATKKAEPRTAPPPKITRH